MMNIEPFLFADTTWRLSCDDDDDDNDDDDDDDEMIMMMLMTVVVPLVFNKNGRRYCEISSENEII